MSDHDNDGSVGSVETQVVRLFTAEAPLHLAGGATLGPVDVAYETYGTLNADRSNAVFICHALTGDAHAAGWHPATGAPGWWDNLIGPGKPLDTDRFFVVSANLLGRVPGHDRPVRRPTRPPGRPYGLDFPLLDMADFVTVHRALLAHLGSSGSRRLGGSLGGMQVLDWTLSHPQEIDNALIFAASSAG